MEEAPKNEWLLKVKQSGENIDVPSRPQDAEWPSGSEVYREALTALAPSRNVVGMGGFLPIPFEAYDLYARRKGIKGQDFDVFHAIMRALDDVCLKFMKSKVKSDARADR